ncbi:MAG: nucleotidyltransferase domain-containing protein [Candidatus Sumerlaeota bacterium]|nr:nucleotidyltransferase domain-containing protein [Candidatus Sumerlaeota bacterium]
MVNAQLKNEIVRRLRESLDPESIILFGSHARGGSNADSDIDLLIVKQGVEKVRQEAWNARLALRGLPAAFDLVVATPQQIERYGQSPGVIYAAALREGEVWYDKRRKQPASG